MPRPFNGFLYPEEGNIFRNNRKDLYSSTRIIHKVETEVQVQKWYDKLRERNYSLQANIVAPLIEGLSELISNLFGAINIYETFAETPVKKDPQGRMLYIEKGYTIVEFSRFYWGDGYTETESEYLIYDRDNNLIYNDAIQTSLILD